MSKRRAVSGEPQRRAELVRERVAGGEPARLVRRHRARQALARGPGTPCRAGTSATCNRRTRPRRSATRPAAASRSRAWRRSRSARRGARAAAAIVVEVGDLAGRGLHGRDRDDVGASRRSPRRAGRAARPRRSRRARPGPGTGTAARRTPARGRARASRRGSRPRPARSARTRSRRPRRGRRRRRTSVANCARARPVTAVQCSQLTRPARQSSCAVWQRVPHGIGREPEARRVQVDRLGVPEVRDALVLSTARSGYGLSPWSSPSTVPPGPESPRSRAPSRERLGFTYLDTGAMYRCVGLAAARHRRARRRGRRARRRSSSASACCSTARDVTDGDPHRRRSPRPASQVAADPAVRAALVAQAAGDRRRRRLGRRGPRHRHRRRARRRGQGLPARRPRGARPPPRAPSSACRRRGGARPTSASATSATTPRAAPRSRRPRTPTRSTPPA